MDDRIAVDPDRLMKMSGPYHETAARFDELRRRAEQLRAQYQNAWGSDDIGNQVGPYFSQVLTAIEDTAGSTRDDLIFHGDGLRNTGRFYADADDDALDSAQSLSGALSGAGLEPVAHSASAATADIAPVTGAEPEPYQPGAATADIAPVDGIHD